MLRFLKWHRWGWLLVICLTLGCALSVIYALQRGQKSSQRLYEPKVLMIRIDEIPFPKNGKKPIDVMSGSPVKIGCEIVGPLPDMGEPSYRFEVGGQVYESSKGEILADIPGAIGSTHKVALDYFLKKPDDQIRVVDHYEALVRIVQGGEYLKIQNIGGKDGKSFEALTAPGEVIPYVEAALKIDSDLKNYTVLFFVELYGVNAPVLQVSNLPHSEREFEPITAQLKRYRSFGPEIGGYAAWPDKPIQLGNEKQARMIFQVYAGIFETKNVKVIVDQLLSYEGTSEKGEVQVKVNPITLDKIKALAWKGWLSDSKRLVRAEDLAENPESFLKNKPSPTP